MALVFFFFFPSAVIFAASHDAGTHPELPGSLDLFMIFLRVFLDFQSVTGILLLNVRVRDSSGDELCRERFWT